MVGASLSSSRNPSFIERNTEALAKICFEDALKGRIKMRKIRDHELKVLRNIEKLSPEEFKMQLSIQKTIYEYKTSGTPSLRVKKILANDVLDDFHKKKEIMKYLQDKLDNAPLDPKVSVDVHEKLIRKLEVTLMDIRGLRSFSRFSHAIYRFCLRDMDKLKGNSYSPAVRLLDQYYNRHKTYPLTGETLEYFYSGSTGTVELAENLKSIEQVNLGYYKKLQADTFKILKECIGQEEADSFAAMV